MNIQIVNRPIGEAPENIRDAWIGLTLPLAPNHVGLLNRRGVSVLSIPRSWLVFRLMAWFGKRQEMRGYVVDARAAIACLDRVSPEAADWWRRNTPQLLKSGRGLLFNEECARMVE